MNLISHTQSSRSLRFLGLLAVLCTLSLAGCSDLPTWVPFQGKTTDTLPGIVSPAEKITELRKLGSISGESNAATKRGVAERLSKSIRTETDPLIRAEIVRTLGEYPDASSDAILKVALKDPDAEVRIAACEAWGKRANDEAGENLSKTLEADSDQDVRLAAIRSLGKVKSPESVAALGKVLSDNDPAMQYRAVLALKEVTGKDLGNNVDQWRQYVSQGQLQPDQTPSMTQRVKDLF